MNHTQLKRTLNEVYAAVNGVNRQLHNNKINNTQALIVLSEAMKQLCQVALEMEKELNKRENTH